MIKFRVPLALLALMTLGSIQPSFALDKLSDAEMNKIFNGYKTGFLIKEIGEPKDTMRYHATVCSERLSPCSTFKIFNSVAGLDSGVLTGPDHPYKWDGKKRPLETHNKDHVLKTAMRDSVVWYFQRVANDIGPERMKTYLQQLHYGNEDMSSGQDKFWLGQSESLRISADEQIKFLDKLWQDKLPVSKNAQETTKEVMKVKSTEKGTLYGKTGTEGGKNDTHVMGWFVGVVESSNHKYAFATNIRSDHDANGRTARAKTESVLTKMGLL